MTTAEFFNKFIHVVCHKVHHERDEYEWLKSRNDVHRIKATTFYQIYKHNVFGSDGPRLSMQEFYRVCGQYLYYDKYVCRHGTEFYYYVMFDFTNPLYIATKDIILKRIAANSPQTLTDLVHIVEAVSKE